MCSVNHLVNDIVQEFRKIEEEKKKLLDEVQEKEHEIKYGEEQVVKLQDTNSIVSASNQFREGQLKQLSHAITSFDEDAVQVLQSRNEHTKAMMAKAWAVLEEMEKDIEPLQNVLKGKTISLSYLLLRNLFSHYLFPPSYILI